LFWRGLFQGELAPALDDRTALAAAIAWVAFVLANLPSANLAIAAGAVVGGAVWVALAWWTGGVLASLACHIVWIGLMIALPVLHPADVAP
jgi:membrane protease YdiL (CAAX protease family)